MKKRNNILLGTALLGTTGVLIGVVVHSTTLAVIAGLLGGVIGACVGWLGGKRYMAIVCAGVVLGTGVGLWSGDRDILIISAGSGGAIFGMVANQIEAFLGK